MNATFRKFIFYLTIILAIFIGGCYSEVKDFEFGDIKWSPELGIPLVDSKFTLIDILEANAANIDYTADANKTILITISDDSLFNQSASEYYSLVDQFFDIPPIFLTQEEIDKFNQNGEINVFRELLVDYPVQDNLNEILIDRGSVVTQVEEDFPANLELTVTLEDPESTSILDYYNEFIYSGGDPINIDESTQQFYDARFLFNEDPSLRQIKFSFQLSLERVDQDLVLGANSLNLDVGLQDLEFGELYGDLSPRDISTAENIIRTDFFGENEALSNIDYYFENPQFKMIFTNSMGMPVRFDINNFMTFKKGQQTEEAINNAIELEASNEGSVRKNEVKFDNAFKNVLNKVPDSVSIKIDGAIDPNNTINNFVTRDSYIQAGYEASLPLEFSLSGLEINQTVSLEGIDTQELQYALFKFTSENSLPIDLDFKADLLDEDSAFVMNLFEGKFLSSGTGSQPTSINDIIRLEDNPDTNANELKDLNQVRRVGIRAAVATTNNGSSVVRITSEAFVQFNLAIQAKYNVDL